MCVFSGLGLVAFIVLFVSHRQTSNIKPDTYSIAGLLKSDWGHTFIRASVYPYPRPMGPKPGEVTEKRVRG